jgi:outer membrane protein, heavy metal efflux system
MRRPRISLLLAGWGLLAACARFHAQPIDPQSTEAHLRARTLSDPGLRAYLERSLTAGPPTLPGQAWDLTTLTVAAFYYHPDLDEARARLRLARAAIQTAGARPNPTLLNLGPSYNIDAAAGVSPWIIGVLDGFILDVPIETAGKRGKRIAQAERLTEAAAIDLARTAWQVRSRVRGALVEYLLARQDLDLLSDEERIRAEAVTVYEKRLEVGDVSRPELDTARIGLANTRLAVRTAEGRVVTSQADLAFALGVPLSALDGVDIAWPGLATPPTEAEVAATAIQRAGLLNRLDIRAGLARYAAAEAGLRLEIARQYPDLHLGPGYTWDQGANKFGIGLTIELPIFNRNQGPIAEAEARRAEAAARFLGLQAAVIAETGKTLGRYRSAREELTDADAATALLRTQESASRRGLEIGEQDRLALVGVRLQRISAERNRLEALRKAQTALGALEDAVQHPLLDGTALPPVPAESPRGS